MANTLTALYHRNEVFWMGLSLFVIGVVTPRTLDFGSIELARWLFVTGGGLLVTSVFLGIYRFLDAT